MNAMVIHKCDVCTRVIKRLYDRVNVMYTDEQFTDFEICRQCAKPIVEFLQRYRLVRG